MITKELSEQLTKFISPRAQAILEELAKKHNLPVRPNKIFLKEFQEKLNELRPDIRAEMNVTSNDAQLALDKTVEFFERIAGSMVINPCLPKRE